jgi:hypothetical protein
MVESPLVLSAFAREVSGVISLVVLGLTYGFSPPLYGVTLHLLARNRRPIRAVVYLTVGMALSATLLLLAFRTFDPTTLAKEFSGEVAHLLVQTVVDLVVGSLLLLAGLVFVVRARRPHAPTVHGRAESRSPRAQAQALIGVGFANTAIGVAPPVTTYVTGRVIGGMSEYLLVQFLGFLVFLAAIIAPYIAAAYLWRRLPTLSSRVARGWARLARIDLRPLVAWGLVVAGAVFLTLGAVTAAVAG